MSARVLVVDDDEGNRLLLHRLLERLGFDDVRVVGDAAAVLPTVTDFEPELILLDLHLGGVGGFEVIAELATHDPGWPRPVLVVTGDVRPDLVRQAKLRGVSDVLTKPYQAAELAEKVAQALAARPAAISLPDAEVDFRLAFESLPANYLVLDTDFRILAASDAYLRVVTMDRAALIGRDILEAFPDNPDDAMATGVANLRASLERVRAERAADTMAVEKYDIQVQGGPYEERWWSVVNSPVIDADGNLVAIVHGAEDVTDFVRFATSEDSERIRMETEILRRSRELHDANVELRAANAAKGEFLSRMSHELRTPLAAILGFSELLSLSTLDTEQAEWARLVHEGGQHLLSLVNDVLAVSRVGRTETAITIEPRAYGRPATVLYVEDVAANVQLVEAILQRRPDIHLVSSTVGGAAVDLAHQHRPDLVLLDLHLPDVSGEEVLRRLRADDELRDVPVVMLTADATPGQADRLVAAGATDYLTKPIGARRLIELVDRFFASQP